MQKHVKELLGRARMLGLDCSARHIGGHYKLTATKDGASVTVPVSTSPTDKKACINMALQMIRRRFLEVGVQV